MKGRSWLRFGIDISFLYFVCNFVQVKNVNGFVLEKFKKYGAYLWDKNVSFCVFLAQSTWEPPPHWEELVH